MPCLFSLSLWQLTPLLLQPYSRKTGNKRGQRQGGKVNVMSSLWKVLFYLCTHTHTHTNTYIRICAQLCQTLCDPLDYSPPGSSVNGIFQARIPEWVTIIFSREIFLTQGFNLGLQHYRQIFYHLSQEGSPKVDGSIHLNSVFFLKSFTET